MRIVADAEVDLVIWERVFYWFRGQARFHIAGDFDAPHIWISSSFSGILLFDTVNDDVNAKFLPTGIELPVEDQFDVDDTAAVSDAILPPATEHRNNQLDLT